MKEFGFIVWNDRNERVVVYVTDISAEAAKWGIESARMEAGLEGTVTKAMCLGELVSK